MLTCRVAGAVLIFAAVAFWLAWALMPDAGTNDAAHILAAVRINRDAVRWSVVVQLVSSVAFVPAVVLTRPATSRVLVGACLVLVGAMGMAADAVFHLAGYYMTADGVAAESVLEPMRLMQTDGLRFLVPLVLPFLFGGWVFASGLRRDGRASRWPGRAFALAFAFALAGAVIVRTTGAGRHAVVLGFLGLIAFGYVRLGYDLALPSRPSPSATNVSETELRQ
jgi:hypothetical protein